MKMQFEQSTKRTQRDFIISIPKRLNVWPKSGAILFSNHINVALPVSPHFVR